MSINRWQYRLGNNPQEPMCDRYYHHTVYGINTCPCGSRQYNLEIRSLVWSFDFYSYQTHSLDFKTCFIFYLGAVEAKKSSNMCCPQDPWGLFKSSGQGGPQDCLYHWIQTKIQGAFGTDLCYR